MKIKYFIICILILSFGGVFTVVIRKTPVIDSEGEVKEEKFKGIYCWVHDKKTREAYDTYKMIDVLGKVGFKDESEQYRMQPRKQDIIVNVDEKGNKKK